MNIPFLATKAKLLHIGGNDELGQFTTPLTNRLPPEDFRIAVAEILNLVPIEEQNHITYVINPVDLLKSFTDNIVKEIEIANQNLFNQLTSKQEYGIFRTFEMDYERILDGELEDGNKLANDLNEIFIYHKNIFLRKKAFIYDNYEGKNKSNIKDVASEFGILVNILLMNITVQFKRKGAKKYFNNNRVIPADILHIKNHLLEMLDNVFQPENFPSNKTFYSCQNLKDFLVWAILEDHRQLEKYEFVTGVEITKQKIQRLLKSELRHQGSYSQTNYSEYKHYELLVTGDLSSHYTTLLDLIAYINLVEKMHQALCKSNETTGEFPTQYLFMLNTAHSNFE